MPELPDITIYIRALNERILGRKLLGIRIASPFVLRTVTPAAIEFANCDVVEIRRLGKQIVIRLARPNEPMRICAEGAASTIHTSKSDDLEHSLFIVIHLMIAGRLQWKATGVKLPARLGLVAFDFDSGALILTEAGTKRRAALHLVTGEADLEMYDRGGFEMMGADLGSFIEVLRRENHTIKRSLTVPRLFSGIGNAYSDEILHRAGLSPFKQTSQFSDADAANLLSAIQEVMQEWIARLDTQRNGGFPVRISAFQTEMAVHGRFDMPCPRCGTPVQRIVYADNESNYCVRCQTGGKLLADRGLSRLLKSDWPKTLEELEARRNR